MGIQTVQKRNKNLNKRESVEFLIEEKFIKATILKSGDE